MPPLLRVSRDPDDARTVLVPADQVRGARLTLEAPGNRRPLDTSALQVYVFCGLVGDVPWHSCGHAPGNGPNGEHSIGVLVHQEGTDAAVYAQLLELARQNRGGRRRRGAQAAARVAAAA